MSRARSSLVLVSSISFALGASVLSEPARAAPLPTAFEGNQGQYDPVVAFSAQGPHATVFVTADALVTVLPETADQPRGAISMRLEGADPRAAWEGEAQLPGRVHRLVGESTVTDIATFERVRQRAVYPGIDLILHTGPEGDGAVEYDFEVAPRADPALIALAFDGAEALSLSPAGDLLAHAAGRAVLHRRPLAWQTIGGRRVPVAVAWQLDDAAQSGFAGARFALGPHDPAHALTIDPPFAYSTFLGGNNYEHAKGVTSDAEGFIYVVGQTSSTDFPLGPGHLSVATKSQSLAFITKLDPNAVGAAGLVWSTYLGGPNGGDTAKDVAVDADGNVYVVGWTTSNAFPVTASALQTCALLTNGNGFMTKLSPDGSSLLYSTCLSGDNVDEIYGVAVDDAARAHLVGRSASSNFPTTANAFQATNTSYLQFDAVAVILDTLASGPASLVYSTYFGDCSTDEGESIALDDAGVMYLTGSSSPAGSCPASKWKPLSLTPRAGGGEAWVTKLDPTLPPAQQVLFTTFLGGMYEEDGQPSGGIGVDAQGNVFVTGSTGSPNFPVTAANLKAALGGNQDAFFTVFSSTGAMLYSTYLGGAFNDFGRGLRVGADGLAYLVGQTSSSDMPVSSCTSQGVKGSGGDAFLHVIDPWANTLVYGTFIGGGQTDFGHNLALDPDGNVIVVGETASANFPVTSGAFQTTAAVLGDAFVTKVHTPASCQLPGIRISDTSVVEGHVGTTTALVDVYLFGAATGPATFAWETFGDSAGADLDYLEDAGEITFDVGVTHQTIALEVLGDWLIEPSERFFVQLTPVAGDAVLQDSLAAVKILDDDVPLAVALGGPQALAEGDTATFTFAYVGGAATSLVPDCGAVGLLFGALEHDPQGATGSFQCHFADGPATSTVSLVVIDQGQASASAALEVAVANLAPSVALDGLGLTDEGTIQTYGFTVLEIGADGFAVSGDPDCGAAGSYVPGSLTTTSAGGAFACSFPDGPAVTAIALAVGDDDGAASPAATHEVFVANVAPSVAVAGPTGVAEGTTASFELTVVEPGDDAIVIDVVSCGAAGSLVAGSLSVSGLPPFVSGSFECAFGNGPADSEVTATASDSDGAGATGALDVAVVELAPIVDLAGPASAAEGAIATYAFTVESPDGAPFALAAGYPDCGLAGQLVAGSLSLDAGGGSFACVFPDGPEASEVAVQVVDADLAPSNVAVIMAQVVDVAPSVSLSGPASLNAGNTATFAFLVADPGDDAFALALGSPDCGAGVLVSASLTAAGGSFECAFPSAGATTVAVQVASDGLASAPATLAITALPAPIANANMIGHGQMPVAGKRVHHGFALDCDAAAAGQQLQVSWPGGHRFSLDVVATLACSDDPALEPGGGVPIDTLTVTGQGRIDGVPGASVSATFADAGEPGSEDRIELELRDAGGAVVLYVSGPLAHGNHQARVD